MLAQNIRKGLEVLHLVQGSTQDNLQHHAVVRHPPLLVVVYIVLSPVAPEAERLYIVAKVARHERIEAHSKGAAAAIALGSAICVAYLRVRVQRDVLVQTWQHQVVEKARCARNAREIGHIVELRFLSV